MKKIRKENQIFLVFVDIEKAFDNVNWTVMFNMMTRMGIKHADRTTRNFCTTYLQKKTFKK